MAAEFEITESKKRRLESNWFDQSTCIFCKGPLSSKLPAVMPDVTKLQTLFAACAVRRDDIGNTLLAKKQDISNGGVVFTYHRNCRATFVSPSILKRLDKDPNKSDAYEKTDITYTHSHASATSFNLKENCFICGMRLSREKIAVVNGSIIDQC